MQDLTYQCSFLKSYVNSPIFETSFLTAKCFYFRYKNDYSMVSGAYLKHLLYKESISKIVSSLLNSN